MRKTLLALGVLAALSAACGYSDPYASTGPQANESPGPSTAASPSPGTDDCNEGASLPAVTYPDGLKITDITVGNGDVAKKGENASMQYTGWLTTCKQFDTSRQPGRGAFTFQIGAGNVIAGWDEGIVGMKVGGKRRLVIPPELGYGPQGQSDTTTGAVIIPPNATLVFVVELVSLAPGPSPSPSPSPSPPASPSPSPSK